MLETIQERLNAILTADRTVALVRAAMIVLAGALIARWGSRGLGRLIRRGDPQRALLIQRLTSWAIFLVSLAWALQELGFQLGVVLGAAGVATVAIGFASQTSLSNLISGFFLFGERPFQIGDIIEVENVIGEVLAIDLMATKLRTFANHYVRIPNEVMIKSKVVNHTRFPIRRLDLELPIAYGEDLERVRRALFEIADRNAHCLAEPAPLLIITGFGDSALTAQFSVWATKTSYLALMTSLMEEIQRDFEQRGIQRPYPHRVVDDRQPGASEPPDR